MKFRRRRFILWGFIIAAGLIAARGIGSLMSADRESSAADPSQQPGEWEREMSRIRWIAYHPPTLTPPPMADVSKEVLETDLALLRSAGFDGLLTYTSKGAQGRLLAEIAAKAGFEGIIAGVWDPTDEFEIRAARAIGALPIVKGYCVGNEGLTVRYSFQELSDAIQKLRVSTAKPVTTSEVLEQYQDRDIFELGDWVFPIVHPYFHYQLSSDIAVQWTVDVYSNLKNRRGSRFVLIKEVGFPTRGDAQHAVGEQLQADFFTGLAITDVRFVYFEGMDQPWKIDPVEQNWGLFTKDRKPKVFATSLLNGDSTLLLKAPFYVYKDADYRGNHYSSIGYMGDIGDIEMNLNCQISPHFGSSCIQITYDPKGRGEGSAREPSKFAGIYWQHPPQGQRAKADDKTGFNLAGYSALRFWARAMKDTAMDFKVGGSAGPGGDSLKYGRTIRADLSPQWKQFVIPLHGADLSNIVSGFCWFTDWKTNPQGIIFYLDDIRFERF